MDDELRHLEVQLERLRPAEPSARLWARIGRDFARPLPRLAEGRLHWLGAAMLPAAAAAAFLAALFLPGPRHDSPPAAPVAEVVLKPVTAENVLVATSDEELITLPDGTPARRERRQYVDTITWKNSRTNASLTWSLPREEVRVVPVVFQ